MKKEIKNKEECKAYTQGKGAYASFHSGAKCKRKAVKKGYCLQHFTKIIKNKLLM